jgi:hypothetical protein
MTKNEIQNKKLNIIERVILSNDNKLLQRIENLIQSSYDKSYGKKMGYDNGPKTENKPDKEETFYKSFGAFSSTKTPESIIKEIKKKQKVQEQGN